MGLKNETFKTVALFFICTLVFSWTIWLSVGFSGIDTTTAPGLLLMMLGGLSPSLFGIIFIIRNRTYSKREFINSFLSFRQIGLKNLAGLISIVLFTFLGSQFLDYVLFENIPSTQNLIRIISSPGPLIFFILTTIYSGPLTEEFGWRGFAGRKLIDRFGLLKTGLIIGTIWSIWHYPMLPFSGSYQIDNYWIYIPTRLIKEISITIIMLYFYSKTGKSVLAVMIIHGLTNGLVNLFYPITISANILHTILTATLAAAIVLFNRKEKPAWQNINQK